MSVTKEMIDRLAELQKEIKEIYYNCDYGICGVTERYVQLREEVFLQHFPTGYTTEYFDELKVQLSINHNGVRYIALQEVEEHAAS